MALLMRLPSFKIHFPCNGCQHSLMGVLDGYNRALTATQSGVSSPMSVVMPPSAASMSQYIHSHVFLDGIWLVAQPLQDRSLLV